MIRVLHIVHALTRGGGLSNFVMNYYRAIDKTKIQFDFIYFREAESDFKDEIKALGGRVYKMTEPSLSGSYKKECNNFFKEHQGEYVALHCHALFAAAMYGKTAKKYGIENIIAHSHSVGYGKGILRKVRNFYLVKTANRISTCKMACSNDAAEFMFGKKNVKNGNVHFIVNAINCKKYLFSPETRQKVRKELGIENNFVLGHVGGFAKQKNHSFIVDVLSEICKIKDNAVVLFAGGAGIASGSSLDDVKEKVKTCGLEDKVHFLGIRQDVNELMMAMDAFIFPSLFEGFGLVLVEAQSSGLISFASENVPKDAKCTDSVTYLPLELGAKEWAERICAAAQNVSDRSVDITAFDRFNIDKQTEILESIYLDMH